jgi:hypothetical protein
MLMALIMSPSGLSGLPAPDVVFPPRFGGIFFDLHISVTEHVKHPSFIQVSYALSTGGVRFQAQL